MTPERLYEIWTRAIAKAAKVPYDQFPTWDQ